MSDLISPHSLFSRSFLTLTHLKVYFISRVFVQVEENQVKHVESTEGTSESPSTIVASCHCVQINIELI